MSCAIERVSAATPVSRATSATAQTISRSFLLSLPADVRVLSFRRAQVGQVIHGVAHRSTST